MICDEWNEFHWILYTQQINIGCVNIGRQERDVVFDDVKRTDSVQGRSLGRGWSMQWRGEGGAELKGKAWESILLCYHVSRGPLYCGQDTIALASNWWLAKVWRKHELQFICCCYPFKHATQHRCYRCYRHVLPMPLIYSLCSSYSIIWWKYLALKVDSSQSTS